MLFYVWTLYLTRDNQDIQCAHQLISYSLCEGVDTLAIVLPHKKYEIKYHQVSPILQRIDYQFCMCDTWLKKSLTKYHQVSPTFLVMIPYKHLSVIVCIWVFSLVSLCLYFADWLFSLHSKHHGLCPNNNLIKEPQWFGIDSIMYYLCTYNLIVYSN